MNATQANRLKSIFGNASASANPLATHNAARVKELDRFIFRFQTAREAQSGTADARSGRYKPGPQGGAPQPTLCQARGYAADHPANHFRARRSSRAADFCQSSFFPCANTLTRRRSRFTRLAGPQSAHTESIAPVEGDSERFASPCGALSGTSPGGFGHLAAACAPARERLYEFALAREHPSRVNA